MSNELYEEDLDFTEPSDDIIDHLLEHIRSQYAYLIYRKTGKNQAYLLAELDWQMKIVRSKAMDCYASVYWDGREVMTQ